MTSVIEVANLTKTYGSTVAVDDLSFEVGAGTVTGFLGPNGAGKTTVIRTLLGLARPTSGRATIFGLPYRELEDTTRVGVVIDGAGFHPLRSGRNHLRAVAAASGIGTDRVEEVLDAVELDGDAHRKAGHYSLGMRQRLALASALLGRPDLLVLDEPANGLDPAGIRWLRGLLRTFATEGGTVFVSSHVLSEMALLADEVIVIDHGRLVTQTNMRDLTSAESVFVRTPDPRDLVAALASRGATVRDLGSDGLEVVGISSEIVGETAADRRVTLHELTPRQSSLEEVFLQLTATNEGSP